jgi:hypothetical protein
MTLAGLAAAKTLDAEACALVWLLMEGGVPLVVAGPASASVRAEVAAALLEAVPDRPWVLLDADETPLTTEQLAAIIVGGVGLGVTLAAHDLRSVLDRLSPAGGLPEDAVRRLGLVVIVESREEGTRVVAMHFLRPTERDAQGHVQRRPPAVLATWDRDTDAHEHFAWGVTPELADRVDRAQADLEERQRDRAAFITSAADERSAWPDAAREYLAAEPPRVPAPEHESAKPSPFGGGLTDSDPNRH